MSRVTAAGDATSSSYQAMMPGRERAVRRTGTTCRPVSSRSGCAFPHGRVRLPESAGDDAWMRSDLQQRSRASSAARSNGHVCGPRTKPTIATQNPCRSVDSAAASCSPSRGARLLPIAQETLDPDALGRASVTSCHDVPTVVAAGFGSAISTERQDHAMLTRAETHPGGRDHRTIHAVTRRPRRLPCRTAGA